MVKRRSIKKKKSKGMPIDSILVLIVGVGMPILWVYAMFTGAMTESVRGYFGIFALLALILSIFYAGTR